jgi:hypothetical protein
LASTLDVLGFGNRPLVIEELDAAINPIDPHQALDPDVHGRNELAHTASATANTV